MNRILILRLSSLGDVVLTTSVLKTLLDNCADTEIFFVTKNIYAPLLRGLVDDERLLLLSQEDDALAIRRRIKEINPNVILDLHNNTRTHVMTFGIANVHRVSKNRLRRMRAIRTRGSRQPATVLNDYRRLLEHALNISSIVQPHLADRGLPTQAGRVLIHPGAKWKLKRWPSENFLALYNLLSGRGFLPIFVGDQKWNYPDYRYVRTGSIDELMDEISRSSLFIGNDSGPSHIAVGLEVPSITIFGPTHPCLGFTPQGPVARYITLEYECSPCTLHGKGRCRLNGTDTAKCLSELTPQAVFDVAVQALDVSS